MSDDKEVTTPDDPKVSMMYWHERAMAAEAALASERAKQVEPIPASVLVTMYAENPTSDADMIEFAREVEKAHGIGAAHPAVQAEPVAWMVINESGQDVYVTADPKLAATGQRALPLYTGPVTERQCTCCPDDTPPVPCPRKYALSECLAAAQSAEPVAVVPANIGDQSGCIRWLIDEQLPVGTLLYAAPPADDEAVRLLIRALGYVGADRELRKKITAYLAKVGK